MEIPLSIFAWFVIRFSIQRFWLRKLSGKKRLLAIATLIVVLFLAGFGAGIYYSDEARRELQKFDTNGDGVYSPHEETEGFEEAMSRVVNDTGRLFGPFFFVFFLVLFEVAFAAIYPYLARVFPQKE
jgi:branched-subunit amino acid ABC-type transport system permease component